MSDYPIFNALPSASQELIEKHLSLVIEANEHVNLTRIASMEEGMLLHVEDSLSALEEVKDAPQGRYADIGSGAGYPGIPLAIATGRPTLLVDSRKKKIDELQRIIGELGLEDSVATYAGRAELLAKTAKGQFSVITARALAKLPVLLELAKPLLKREGLLICYKANIEFEELENAKRVGNLLGMKCVSDRSFTLGKEHNRRILAYQNAGKSKVKLPRQEGQAQRNPL